MLTKSEIKLIKSLENKKIRDSELLFVVEGEKSVKELLFSTFETKTVYCTENWLSKNTGVNEKFDSKIKVIKQDELNKISFLKTPQPVIGIASIPEYQLTERDIRKGLTLVLDKIQDPGNLGTIIRIADWFGITRIVCSPDTVDAFNPKVVQAAMGGLFRTQIFYMPLLNFFEHMVTNDLPVYGALLGGGNIYQQSLSEDAIVVMGNESKGISSEMMPYIRHRLFIPRFPEDKQSSESLNVAVATAIICSEFRRRIF